MTSMSFRSCKIAIASAPDRARTTLQCCCRTTSSDNRFSGLSSTASTLGFSPITFEFITVPIERDVATRGVGRGESGTDDLGQRLEEAMPDDGHVLDLFNA